VDIAGDTWALVVGIDDYADPQIPKLRGAVADAVAFADWLRAIGVPDRQVLFHAAPTRASRKYLKGRKPEKASAVAINDSIVALEKVAGGKRLIVYLAGHGVYEPTAGRLFLVEEFTQDTPMNMSLDRYVQRFLAMPFERQFLFVDGCQNLPYSESQRQEIVGEMYGGRNPRAPVVGNRLVACYAASMGELAREVEERGLFTRYLLEAIDPESPATEGVFLDFVTGRTFVDVRRAVTDYVGPSVREEARDTPQTPQVQAVPGETQDVSPFYDFRADVPPGKLTVQIDPGEAVTQIEGVYISVSDRRLWSFSRPRPPERQLAAPFDVHVPVGLDVKANCLLRRDSPWAGTLEKQLQVAAETSVIFKLTPPAQVPTAHTVDVRTVDPAGVVLKDQFSYSDVEAELSVGGAGIGAPGVRMDHREIGPVFTPAEGASLEALLASRRMAGEWAQAILKLTPDGVGVSTILTGPPPDSLRPRLLIGLPRGGAAALAGPLAGSRLAWVGPPGNAPAQPLSDHQNVPHARSITSLELAEIEVEPGHVLVRIDLPWGSWSSAPEALPGDVTSVEIPSSIGDPPLRVRLFPELARRGSLLLGVGGRAPAPVLGNGLHAKEHVKFRSTRKGSASWAFSAPAESWLRRPGAVGIVTAGGWSFPFLYQRSLGFSRVGRHVQIEPLSAVPSTSWDLLLARGLLDALPADAATQLTYDKWRDALLGLAGAYAVYALPADKRTIPFLETVLRNLRMLSKRRGGTRVPDLELLSAALTVRTEEHVLPEDRQRLERWAMRRAVPVLRWGVPLAVRLIEDGYLAGAPFDRWHEELRTIERTLSPVSVWTAWRSSARGRR
jgi:Caspase domain